jgi:hypothetical protein
MKHQMVFASSMAGRAGAPAPYVAPDMTWFLMANAVAGVLTSIAGLAAIAWFGMWMGLTNRKTSLAVLKTVCYVIVLPWIALMFARIFLMIGMIPFGIRGSQTAMLVVPTLTIALLSLGKDGFFIWWSHRSLRVNFREQVTGDRGRHSRISRPITPPPRPPPSFLPPPIPPAANAI